MSISWNVETRVPVDPQLFLDRLGDVVDAVLGVTPDNMVMAEDGAADAVWSWPPSNAETGLSIGEEYFVSLTATVGGLEMRCRISATPAVEDDGTVLPGSTYADIEALRTQTSASFALTAALAFALAGQGDLSGTRVEHTDTSAVPVLLDAFTRPEGQSPITERVHEVAARLGCADLPFLSPE